MDRKRIISFGEPERFKHSSLVYAIDLYNSKLN